MLGRPNEAAHPHPSHCSAPSDTERAQLMGSEVGHGVPCIGIEDGLAMGATSGPLIIHLRRAMARVGV